MKISKFKQQVTSLAKTLPDKSDAEWLIAVYLSLETAEDLGYVRDSFARLNRKTRNSVNVQILYRDLLEPPQPSDVKKKMWLAGYYFNNALFRMVALAEITLKLLFEREMKIKSPNNYWWLVDWYKRKFDGKLKYIASARARVNKLKHDLRDRKKPKALESYADGLKAFKELLKLMSLIC